MGIHWNSELFRKDDLIHMRRPSVQHKELTQTVIVVSPHKSKFDHHSNHIFFRDSFLTMLGFFSLFSVAWICIQSFTLASTSYYTSCSDGHCGTCNSSLTTPLQSCNGINNKYGVGAVLLPILSVSFGCSNAGASANYSSDSTCSNIIVTGGVNNYCYYDAGLNLDISISCQFSLQLGFQPYTNCRQGSPIIIHSVFVNGTCNILKPGSFVYYLGYVSFSTDCATESVTFYSFPGCASSSPLYPSVQYSSLPCLFFNGNSQLSQFIGQQVTCPKLNTSPTMSPFTLK